VLIDCWLLFFINPVFQRYSLLIFLELEKILGLVNFD